MKDIYRFASNVAGCLTACYVTSVLVFRTNGILFAGVTNALLALFFGVTAYAKKKEKTD